MPSDARPAPGRPTAIDADELARVAIRLFRERGYDEVSMADIAEAAGVGRRSLFRYYPSKADLVWAGQASVATVLTALLDAEPDGRPLGEVYADAFVEALRPDTIDLELARVRLSIIDSRPDLRGQASARLGAQGGMLDAFVARYRPDLAGTVEAAVLVEALGSASYSGLRWWARHSDDPHPAASIRRAVAALAEAHVPVPAGATASGSASASAPVA